MDNSLNENCTENYCNYLKGATAFEPIASNSSEHLIAHFCCSAMA